MRPGTRIGVDVGTVRVGVAASDPSGVLATPVRTLARDVDGGADLRELPSWCGSGRRSRWSSGCRARCRAGTGRPRRRPGRTPGSWPSWSAPVPVRLVDERLSTVTAHQALRGSGVRERKGRRVVDQVAAVVILQLALDAERSSGRPAGEPVEAGG